MRHEPKLLMGNEYLILVCTKCGKVLWAQGEEPCHTATLGINVNEVITPTDRME